jgi:transposase-like protein
MRFAGPLPAAVGPPCRRIRGKVKHFNRDALLTFYDFPAEHWKHLRTTNLIEPG